jgi:hypothetical protein
VTYGLAETSQAVSQYLQGVQKRESRYQLHEIRPAYGRSFFHTNLKYMRYFYETFPDAQNRPQLVDDLDTIFMIPWGHYRYILNKCRDNQDKALFYVRKTLENGWSRAMLLNFLDTDLYERQGKAITNFDMTLPERDSDLAQEITKDPYNFDFLTLTDRYNEKEMKEIK